MARPAPKLIYRLITLFAVSLMIIPASTVSGHPGKTDHQDGHRCLRNCEDWGMHYKEYHLHDRDRRAIRSDGRRQQARPPENAKASETGTTKQVLEAVAAPASSEPQTSQISIAKPHTSAGQGFSMQVEKAWELSLYQVILSVVAGLLLLLLILLRKKRQRDRY